MTIFLIILIIYKLETRVESLSFFLVKSSSFMANCKSSPNLQTFPHREEEEQLCEIKTESREKPTDWTQVRQE